jgi:uncharacterized membrane protein
VALTTWPQDSVGIVFGQTPVVVTIAVVVLVVVVVVVVVVVAVVVVEETPAAKDRTSQNNSLARHEEHAPEQRVVRTKGPRLVTR